MANTISEDDRLKALALVTSANDLYRQACLFERALHRLLNIKVDYFGEGKLGDLIYDVNAFTVAAFDAALAEDGFILADDSQPR